MEKRYNTGDPTSILLLVITVYTAAGFVAAYWVITAGSHRKSSRRPYLAYFTSRHTCIPGTQGRSQRWPLLRPLTPIWNDSRTHPTPEIKAENDRQTYRADEFCVPSNSWFYYYHCVVIVVIIIGLFCNRGLLCCAAQLNVYRPLKLRL